MKAMISRRLLSPILLIGCLFVLPGTTARARGACSDPIYVDASAAGTGSGTSWPNAMTSLQDGLASAATCDSTAVWVAAGTYKPDQGVAQTLGDRLATFQLIDGVAIYGGFPSGGGDGTFGARDIVANQTILSGDLAGDDAPLACVDDSPDCDSNGELCVDGFCIIAQNNSENSYHVVTSNGTGTAMLIDGFTITAGNAGAGFPTDRGGGMYNISSSPAVTNCMFSGNFALFGGGMFNYQNSSPTVTHCTFSGNSSAARGGAMYNGGSPTVTSCMFSGNSTGSGGGMHNINSSSPIATNCTFSGNLARGSGGGMYNAGSSSPTVTNCTFSGNLAHQGDGMYNLSPR